MNFSIRSSGIVYRKTPSVSMKLARMAEFLCVTLYCYIPVSSSNSKHSSKTAGLVYCLPAGHISVAWQWIMQAAQNTRAHEPWGLLGLFGLLNFLISLDTCSSVGLCSLPNNLPALERIVQIPTSRICRPFFNKLDKGASSGRCTRAFSLLATLVAFPLPTNVKDALADIRNRNLTNWAILSAISHELPYHAS